MFLSLSLSLSFVSRGEARSSGAESGHGRREGRLFYDAG